MSQYTLVWSLQVHFTAFTLAPTGAVGLCPDRAPLRPLLAWLVLWSLQVHSPRSRSRRRARSASCPDRAPLRPLLAWLVLQKIGTQTGSSYICRGTRLVRSRNFTHLCACSSKWIAQTNGNICLRIFDLSRPPFGSAQQSARTSSSRCRRPLSYLEMRSTHITAAVMPAAYTFLSKYGATQMGTIRNSCS
jgi:hypothetical protein